MILLIGPCMFVAPLLVLLIPVALVLWPPALILTGLAWLVVWPFAATAKRPGPVTRLHATLGRWFGTLLKPWNYFDVPTDASPPSPPPPQPPT